MPIFIQGPTNDPGASTATISPTSVTFTNAALVSFTKDPTNPDDEGGKIVDLILQAIKKMTAEAIVFDLPRR